jgi:pseudouridine kinase
VRSATIACIGGAHRDHHAVLHAPSIPGTSNPGSVFADDGGVARNVAVNLARLGRSVLLCSRVGNDEAGRVLLAESPGASLITVSDRRPTASYTAILEPTGELVIGLADMDIYDELRPGILEPALPTLREAAFWFLDANLPTDTIAWLLAAAGEIPTAMDAVSVAKSQRLARVLPEIRYLFCNVAQAAAIAATAVSQPAAAAESLRQAGSRAGIVSAGAAGIAVYEGSTVQTIPALPATPRDVTGAGDALAAGVLFGLTERLDLFASARLGLAAAAIGVESQGSTAAELSREAVLARA